MTSSRLPSSRQVGRRKTASLACIRPDVTARASRWVSASYLFKAKPPRLAPPSLTAGMGRQPQWHSSDPLKPLRGESGSRSGIGTGVGEGYGRLLKPCIRFRKPKKAPRSRSAHAHPLSSAPRSLCLCARVYGSSCLPILLSRSHGNSISQCIAQSHVANYNIEVRGYSYEQGERGRTTKVVRAIWSDHEKKEANERRRSRARALRHGAAIHRVMRGWDGSVRLLASKQCGSGRERGEGDNCSFRPVHGGNVGGGGDDVVWAGAMRCGAAEQCRGGVSQVDRAEGEVTALWIMIQSSRACGRTVLLIRRWPAGGDGGRFPAAVSPA
ncbi:hypothetical protein BDZ90DRAFT_47313 [Jaminaea rosea]|uniref:Uncharacterized protein n=1 Tax=Jaminaea rosea TaxID=1569628 RepID=A0A316UMZ2_9BASI|nr:hypothetical protein BDZ90DRAFT_47313 [Jaminaea rosea]PWN26178.1 hypothetical protein BDZ90DRAFT_47313 [Jaminaea rosea]